MCQAFNITFDQLRGYTLDGHVYKNILARESAKALKEQILNELTLDEVAEFMFDKFPSKGVLKALSVLIGRAKDMHDLQNAYVQAKVFENINDYNISDSTTKITLDLHALIDDIELFLDLSTSKESEGGELISHNESIVILKLIADMDRLQQDLAMFVNSRTVR